MQIKLSLESILGNLPFLKSKLLFVVDYLAALLPAFPYKRSILLVSILLIITTLLAWIVFKVCKSVGGLFHSSPAEKGDKLFAKGKYEKALRYFQKAGRHQKVAQCYLKLGQVLDAAKLFEKASEYEMAAKYYSQEGEYLRAANIYQMSGRVLDAAEKFELGGDHKAAADLYSGLKYLKKAEEMYLKINDTEANAKMYYREFEEESRKTIPPDDPKAIERRSRLLREFAMKSGMYFRMVPNFSSAAEVFIKGGHQKEAAECYEEGGKYLEAAQHYVNIGLKREAARAFEKAENYEDALELYRLTGEHDAVASIMEKMGRGQEAAEYRAMIDLKRGQKIEAAQSYIRAGKVKEAAELFNELKNYDKAAELFEQCQSYAEAGDAYRSSGQLERAAAMYIQANRFSSAAQCYLQLNKEDKYIEMLVHGGAFLEAGMYLEDKDEEKAISILQKIEPESPDYRFACNLLGRIFLKKGMDNVASEKLELAVEGQQLSKDNLDFFYDIADLRAKQNRKKEAIKILDGILAIDYNYKEALPKQNELSRTIDDEADQSTTGAITHAGLPPEVVGAPETSAGAQIINQRYTVVSELGRGGMGVVYRADDSALQRTVALKFLPPALSPQKKDVEKFLNEARSAARLNHPNIVTVYDIDVDQSSNSYFIVMEFVDGVNLKEIVESSHNLPYAVIKLISKQICGALTYAHGKDVVHRDIKSANILWTNDKVVKVTDFGLAKIVSDSLAGSTKAQGSPVYMSPEQVLGKAVDPRTDIYSFGISLYEMVTGKVPFDRGDIGYHHINTPPPPPETHREDLPPEFAEIILKCIEKDPEQRYQTPDEVVTALDAVAT